MTLRARKGFTLVELMVVVVILGVLAVLALFAYRKYTYAARSAEAVQFLGAMRAAQETYFQSFGQYAGTLNAALHPAVRPFETKELWNPPANSPFRDLGVQSPGRVWFQYRIVAGRAGEAPPVDAPILASEVTGRPWYWLGACGDFNGDAAQVPCDGRLSRDRPVLPVSFFETSSIRADVVVHHEGQ